MSPIPQTSNWSGTFFAVSYSKRPLATTIWVKSALPFGNLCQFIMGLKDFSFLFLQEITKSQKRLLQLTKMLGFANKSSSVSQAIKEMNANKNMYFKSSDEILNQYIKELNIIKPRLKSIFDETEILNDRVYKVKVSIVTKGFYLTSKE